MKRAVAGNQLHPQLPVLPDILNDSCNALTAAHTSRYHSIFFIQPLHIAQ